MKNRVLSILILFLLITSVSIPVVSAKESTIEDGVNLIESIHEYGKIQKLARESSEMQEININGVIRAAEGALAGATAGGAYGAVIGGATGAASGIIEGYVNKILKEEENETSDH